MKDGLSPRIHDVLVVIGPEANPRAVSEVERMSVTNDMLELADPFDLDLPWTKELWDASPPDTEVQIQIDGVRVLTGYIDKRVRTGSRSGSSINLAGRDRAGRLVDESAPLTTYGGLGIADLAKQVVAPWFTTVTLSNARNRRLIRGKGRKAAVSGEPPILAGKDVQKKVEPGETRGAVLTHLCEEANLLCWSSADGREFVIGKPNYAQGPQWHFLAAAPDSARAEETNVESFEYVEDVSDRYSLIEVCGTGRGNGSNYGSRVMNVRGEAKNSPSISGTGKDFAHPKWLLVADGDVRSAKQAQERADREMALRDAGGVTLSLQVEGFGQALFNLGGFAPRALFGFDTVARWEDEEAGVRGDFLVTRVRFDEDRAGGQSTELSLVPLGTELRVR